MLRHGLAVGLVLFSSVGFAADPASEPDIVFASPGGTDLKLDFVRPAGDGPFPLVVGIHGGGWVMGSRKEFAEAQVLLAKAGYAVASVQYRFAPKYQFPAQLDDVTAAIRFLVANAKKYKLDPDRIGLAGGSAGGHLALMAGFTPAKEYKIRCILNICGPTDLRDFVSTKSGDAALKSASKFDSAGLLAALIGTADRKDPKYAAASPITLVTKDSPPVLTFHGTADQLVPVSQAEALHAALKKAGAKEKLVKFEGGDHDGKTWSKADHLAFVTGTVAFLEENLKK